MSFRGLRGYSLSGGRVKRRLSVSFAPSDKGRSQSLQAGPRHVRVLYDTPHKAARDMHMRKRIIDQGTQVAPPADDRDWLELEQLAEVELTSEDAGHPIESALLSGKGSGWRAEQPGKQIIRFLFHKPQRITHIRLMFQEDERARTQEFVLRWSADGGAPPREIVRQQYNFSPPNVNRELEDYTVHLDGLTTLELGIIPDIGGGEARASLAQLRLA